MKTASLLALVLVVSIGCDDNSSGSDAGAMDGGQRFDGATFEAGPAPPDAAHAIDAGPHDGGAGADGMHPFVYLNDDVLARLRASSAAHTSAATRFEAVVDEERASPGTVYAFEPWYAALRAQVSGDSSYCDDAIAWTDAWVVDEEELIDSGMRPGVAGDSYLEVGGIIGNLALVYDWCFDGLSDSQTSRWLAYANQAVHNVWNHDAAEWGGNPFPWSGWSVDDPANNYYYSFLRATMLLGLATRGENDRADEWLRIFREDKLGDQLVPTFERDLQGGGSREGTGYGTALKGLFDLYVLWEQSTAERVADLTSHTRASLPHMLHAIVPGGSHLVPVGDQARESTAALFDYHRHYLLALADLYGGEEQLSGVAWTFLREGPLPEMDQPFMRVFDFLYDEPDATAHPLSELATVYHGTGTGQFYLRSSWDDDATLVHVIGGPFTQSHAHEDQGSIMIWHRQWLAYDANVETHSGIRQEVELHNLVRLVSGGETMAQRRERSPSSVIALHDAEDYAWVAVDAAPVYDDPAVSSLRRDVIFIRPSVVVVIDRVDVDASVTPIWQLNVPVSPAITDAAVSIAGDASTLRVHRVLPAASAIDARTIDWEATDSDFNGGYRLELAARSGGPVTFVNVLAVDGAVSSVSALGSAGVTATLADGSSAAVDLAAGTISIGGTTTTLSEAVETIDVFASP